MKSAIYLCGTKLPVYLITFLLLNFIQRRTRAYSVLTVKPSYYDRKYGSFPEDIRKEMAEEARRMFQFGYENYMKYAFPKDELNPIYCTGRGPDYDDPSNININDVLGDFSLTLVDSLDTLAVMGNVSEFKHAVKLVIENVSFDKNNTVQVFEVNIRMLGSMLSAHLLMIDPHQPFGDLMPDGYSGELLLLARDLANRLLPAFNGTKTGIPYPRVNLKTGVPRDCDTHTCTAGAGSLLVEFGMLSRLLGDPIYETLARRAVTALWKLRAKDTGLLGNVIDVESGEWVGKMSGVGAGLDSFYEYLLKSYILFGNQEDYRMFNESYTTIKKFARKGRRECNSGYGEHPVYINVNMNDGSTLTLWIDSLQAAFAGVQVIHGDVEEAICTHALYYTIWRRFGALPERFNWRQVSPDLSFYPLRPELIESTYLLYQATKNPFYLHVGREIMQSLNNYTRADCGYATIHDVTDKSLEDRMESFFLSETCKYLYLLFDVDNPVNRLSSQYIFTTEGHILPITWRYRANASLASMKPRSSSSQPSCNRVNEDRQYFLPLKSKYFLQISRALGLDS